MTKCNQRLADSELPSNSELESLADLCAVGAVPIPSDLSDHQQQQLLVAIGARRRKRLLHLFAAAIADDIWREQQIRGEGRVNS